MVNNLSEVFSAALLMNDNQRLIQGILMRSLDEQGETASSSTEELRELVIRRTLRAAAVELRRSKDRFQRMVARSGILAERLHLPVPVWSTQQQVDIEQFRQAIMKMDLFPRCVLLLTAFVKLRVSHVAKLIGANELLVQIARSHGLAQLASNIALQQGWANDLQDLQPRAALAASTSH